MKGSCHSELRQEGVQEMNVFNTVRNEDEEVNQAKEKGRWKHKRLRSKVEPMRKRTGRTMPMI
jgi:hypothetical protein